MPLVFRLSMYLLVVCTSVGCERFARYQIDRVHQRAKEAVEVAMVGATNKQGFELRTTGNRWGEGLFVYGVEDGRNCSCVWLFSRGVDSYSAYAIGTEEFDLTPGLMLLRDGPKDVQLSAGLANVRREEILAHLAQLPR